jgi:hypothetical protein
MGAWFRLKASFDISGYSAGNQVILRALKKHGLVLADNGSPWFMSGVPDPSWNNTDLNALRSVPGSAFEAVDVSSLKLSSTSYAVAGSAPPPPPPPPPAPSPELVSNPGFETGLAGWATGNSRTTLARTCAVAHGGSCAAELGRSKSSGSALLDDVPSTVAASAVGARYVASAWVRAPAGRTITLRVRELGRTSVVATITGDGSWRQLVVTTAPTAGSALGVEIVVSLARGSRAQVDDVSLRRS